MSPFSRHKPVFVIYATCQLLSQGAVLSTEHQRASPSSLCILHQAALEHNSAAA